MRQHHGLGRVLGALLACSWFTTLGCQSPGSQRIVGPDGSPMAHVHCGSEQGVCFRLAGELCPSGYEIKPVLSGSDGNFLVRCRSATAPAAVATAQCPTPPQVAAPVVVAVKPAPTPTVAVKSPTSKDVWPPTTEPSPPANPWGEVDLGY